MHRIVGDAQRATRAEQSGYGRTLQIGVEHAGRGFAPSDGARECRRHVALADAALAADDGDDTLHVAEPLDDAGALTPDLLA